MYFNLVSVPLFNMFCDGHTAKCRSNVGLAICFGDASSFGVKLFLVCVHILKTIRKKCADYLAVWKIRVNTHTHTHILSRVFYRLSVKYQSVSKSVFLLFRSLYAPTASFAPYTSTGFSDGRIRYSLRWPVLYEYHTAGHRGAFCPTPNKLKPDIQ